MMKLAKIEHDVFSEYRHQRPDTGALCARQGHKRSGRISHPLLCALLPGIRPAGPS